MEEAGVFEPSRLWLYGKSRGYGNAARFGSRAVEP